MRLYNFLLRIFVVVLSSFSILLTSCESATVSRGREAIMRFYRRFMPHPETMKILKEEYKQNGKQVDWVIVVESKTYDLTTVRDTDTFNTYQDRVMIVNGMFYWDDKIEYQERRKKAEKEAKE